MQSVNYVRVGCRSVHYEEHRSHLDYTINVLIVWIWLVIACLLHEEAHVCELRVILNKQTEFDINS